MARRTLRPDRELWRRSRGRALPDGRLRLVNHDASGRAAGGIAGRPSFSTEGSCPGTPDVERFILTDGENRVSVLVPLPAAACAGAATR